MMQVFILLLIAAIVGIVRPFGGLERRHFAWGALGALIGFGANVPPPTPQELAARKAAEARNAAEEAKTDHVKVVEKGQAAIAGLTPYTRREYRKTFDRIGAATFGQLGRLEPGAVWTAAESQKCDKVASAMVSERSKAKKALWFVDCENGNRFMVEQGQAEAALSRFRSGALAFSDLDASCTIDTVAMCKATPAQRAAIDREIEFVSACDLLLGELLVSPSSLQMQGRWSTDFGKNDTVIYRRAFDSQNAFGATIRSRYRCDINALSGNIERLEVQGPMGTKRFI